ncbi:MAG TPA: tetratricopeptide repeat protein [Alphaproteobacteria bacterium]|nr:tetratricopeptide repeat protein [Alphaproteobacteria bacterium]
MGEPEKSAEATKVAPPPQDPEAAAEAAAALLRAGEAEAAAILLARALAADAGSASDRLYVILVEALEKLGRAGEAADVRNELGTLLLRQRRFSEALALFDAILAASPTHLAARANRGAALSGLGRHDEAIKLLAALVEREPRPAIVNEYGNALLAAGRIDEAVAAFEHALAREPDNAMAVNNLAVALERRTASNPDPTPRDERAQAASIESVIEHYRRALALAPDAAIIHWNLALVLLMLGRFPEGWAEYEWRWRLQGFGEPDRNFAPPLWRGASPEALGGPLLVTMEQGFGDAIQFARYVPLLARRGYRVILEVARELHTLFQHSFGDLGVEVIARMDDPRIIAGDPRFAAHVSLMSLPQRFGTTLSTIPTEIPYLGADPVRAAHWRAALPPGFRVGLAWAGRPEHHNDRNRSLPFAALRPLLSTPGVQFVSLQKPPAEDAAAAATDAAPPLRLGSRLTDFAETAAVIAGLDLVIAVDTAVAHLAGALGRPCWLLLPSPADWRWLLGRADSPWYPTLRLYRQAIPGDWDGVVARVARDLALRARERARNDSDGIPHP